VVDEFLIAVRPQDENSARVIRDIIATYCAPHSTTRYERALLKSIVTLSPKLRNLLKLLVERGMNEIKEEMTQDKVI
jgi:hypothetical protein